MIQRKGYRHIVLAAVLLSIALQDISAQRIIGYFPNYRYTAANAATIQYTKLTHLYYFSLNPTSSAWGQSNGSLWYNDPYAWFTTASFNDVIAKARAANPSIKIIIVTGGAPGSDADLSLRLEYIGNNPAILNTFCNNIISFITTNNLDGWDLDWEFPDSPGARTAHQNMLAAMRTKIDALKITNCKPYEITIAVGGGYTDITSPRVCWGNSHTDYLNAASIGYVDFVNIMAYDAPVGSPPCSFASQQHYDVVVKSFNDWQTAFPSLPASKINIGVGFYDNSHTAFNSIGNVSTRYNMTYWNGGSGCPNMQTKIDFTRIQGAAGIFIWELTQDNLCAGTTPACYSLLDCIYQYTQSTWGAWTPPSDPCTLPVVLSNFTAKEIENGTLLEWTTSTETNNQKFDVEKSFDGINFTVIASIAGSGNSSSAKKYYYIDATATTDITYYRLNQYDVDGKSTASHILSVSSGQKETRLYTISKNPFEETLSILVNRPEQENNIIHVTITDLSGRVFINETHIIQNSLIETGKNLPAGIFVCTLTSDYNSTSIKILKK